MTSPQRNLSIFCVVFYLALSVTLVMAVHHGTGGHFVYALDDPYIHLALAENLAHGHYGINPGEFTSPSSSILWPFLLVPMVGTRFHSYMPLLWNLLFGALAAGLIGYFVGRWPPQRDLEGRMPGWQQAFVAVLLLFIANLAGLTMLGMEHVLQVLLAVCCAVGLAEALSGREMPAWCVAAAVLAPSVRYEDVTLTVAVCCVLAGMRRWKSAVAVFAASMVPLVAFSLFLKRLGLPLLPLSVLLKGHTTPGSPVRLPLSVVLRQTVLASLLDPDRLPMVVLFAIFVVLAWRAKAGVRRAAFGGAAAAAGLQLAGGHFNWFHRYEVYAFIFLMLLLMRVLSERPRFSFGYFALALVVCAAPYINGTAMSVSGGKRVYRQQYQMHRFVTEFYNGDYAVNDVGLVSYRRRPGAYVLDVYGLASVEAWRQKIRSSAWLAGVVAAHHVDLAMVYADPDWNRIPRTWVPVGKMCLTLTQGFLGGRCVVFYSTNPARETALREEVDRFARTLPSGALFYFGRQPNEESMWLPLKPEN